MTKKILFAFLLACSFVLHADSLSNNIERVAAAATNIFEAIRAKGGTVSGGLKNAANDILAIPDKTAFEQTYVAWSNETMTAVFTNFDNCTYMMPYVKLNGQHYLLDGVYANQDTFSEIAVSDFTGASGGTEYDIFGDRTSSSARYGMHVYLRNVSVMYASSWGDNARAAAANMTITEDGNLVYVDGVLVRTNTKTSFRTSRPLAVGAQTDGSGFYGSMNGKIHYVDIRRAVDSTGNLLPDMLFVPVAYNGKVYLVDVLNNSPTSSGARIAPNTDVLEDGAYTNILYDVYSTSFATLVPYETNVVGSAENKLIMNSAMDYIYDNLAPSN